MGDVAIVSAAQFLPFAMLALPAGVWADRLDRRKILVTSDATRFLCQLTGGVLLVTGYGAGRCTWRCWLRSTGPPTRSSRRPSPACCRAPSHRSTAAGQRAARPELLDRLDHRSSAGRAAGRLRRRTGGAFLFDAATFAVSIGCLIPLRPRLVAAGAARRGPAGDRPATSSASLKEGWSEVRSRSWVTAFLGGMASYHVIVLPAIFVLGPVLADARS